jgi:Kef-type K+ transport system membrane component KefB
MKNLASRLKNNFNAMQEDDERGDIVQTLLIIVIFVVIVVAVGKLLWPVINGQANKVSKEIKNGTNQVIVP